MAVPQLVQYVKFDCKNLLDSFIVAYNKGLKDWGSIIDTVASCLHNRSKASIAENSFFKAFRK